MRRKKPIKRVKLDKPEQRVGVPLSAMISGSNVYEREGLAYLEKVCIGDRIEALVKQGKKRRWVMAKVTSNTDPSMITCETKTGVELKVGVLYVRPPSIKRAKL